MATASELIAAASGVRSTLTCGLTTVAGAQHIALPRIRQPPFDVQTERVARDLHTSLTHGLSAHDVQSRLVAYGKNVIYEKRKFHIWLILWRQIANAITFVLVVALVISFAVKDYPEGGVIAGTYSGALSASGVLSADFSLYCG
jgi:magnesium-transporting ATPase (P-type)